MKRVLSLVLIIGGVILIAIPIVGKYRTKKLQQNMIKEFYANTELESNEILINPIENEKLNNIFQWGDEIDNQNHIMPIDINESVNEQAEDTQNIDDNTQNNAENNTEGNTESSSSDNNTNIIDNSNEDNNTNNSNNLKKKPKIKQKPKAIAVISINKIDVKLPVANGLDLETLKYAIGYMPSSGKFGEIGNAVLAGHRSHTYGVFFNRLDELEIGDEIVIDTDNKEYVYTVYEKKIVEPDDVSVMRGSSKFKVITLITCDPIIGATHRLIIHGVIKEK